MNIRRINSYEDSSFSQEVLNQHGAFLIDDKYRCQFKIISSNTARLSCDRSEDIDAAIEEFRFYSENIISFEDETGRVLRKFPDMELISIEVNEIQPSQFYVNDLKVKALDKYIISENDVVIPITSIGNKYVSLDGHTRLHIAVKKGFTKVRAYFTEPGEYIEEFVLEAKKRGVANPRNLVILTNDEYAEKWHKFCDDFFAQKK